MNLLKPYGSVLAVLHRLLDGLLIAAVCFGVNLALDREPSATLAATAGAAWAIFLVVAESQQLYQSWRLRSLDEEFRSAMFAWLLSCASLVVLAFLLKLSATYSRIATLAWFLCTPAFLLASRFAVRLCLGALRKRGANLRTVAVAGSSQLAEGILQKLEHSSSFGLKVAGVFDDRPAERIQRDGVNTTRHAGSLNDLVERARRGGIDYVFIALPLRAEARIIELVNRLADTTASVYVVPDLFVFDLMRARMTTLGGMPAVSVYESPFDGVNGWLKRSEDLVLGSLLLALAALPMLAVAIALKASSRESIFFRQQRYGLNGRVVRVWKFRTMSVSEDGADVVCVAKHEQDARVTPVGRFLRATSLDELPQLFNVIAGDMSLVGPRPHAVKVNEDFRRLIHGYMLRHKVKPGITGWAQVNGWHGEDTVETMQKRVDHDLAYLQNWSLWLDVKILAFTVAGVVSRTRVQRQPQ